MDDPLMKSLSPRDERSLSLTGPVGSETVKSFHRRAYRIELHLRPFFTLPQFNEFRIVQASTGLLISGESALFFFDRTPCNDSVLELYVHHDYAIAIHDFLTKIGYTLHPRWGTKFDDINKTLNDMMRGLRNAFPSRQPPHFSDPGIVGVFPYRNDSGVRIEVMTTLFCPLQAVLNFPASTSCRLSYYIC